MPAAGLMTLIGMSTESPVLPTRYAFTAVARLLFVLRPPALMVVSHSFVLSAPISRRTMAETVEIDRSSRVTVRYSVRGSLIEVVCASAAAV